MAEDIDATEAGISQSLKHSGANDSLARAVADVAVDAGWNRMQVSYDDRFATATLQVPTPVPDAVHERLTGMGFSLHDKYDREASTPQGSV